MFSVVQAFILISIYSRCLHCTSSGTKPRNPVVNMGQYHLDYEAFLSMIISCVNGPTWLTWEDMFWPYHSTIRLFGCWISSLKGMMMAGQREKPSGWPQTSSPITSYTTQTGWQLKYKRCVFTLFRMRMFEGMNAALITLISRCKGAAAGYQQFCGVGWCAWWNPSVIIIWDLDHLDLPSSPTWKTLFIHIANRNKQVFKVMWRLLTWSNSSYDCIPKCINIIAEWQNLVLFLTFSTYCGCP